MDEYRQAYDRQRDEFGRYIESNQSRAFEYGVIVIKNAVLISGGGLLATPTILTVADSVRVDSEAAIVASLFFTASLLLSIIGCYLVHLNWTLHTSYWTELWNKRADMIHDHFFGESGFEAIASRKDPERLQRWIGTTFWASHALALVYLILIGLGFYFLYSALGVLGATA